MIPPSTETTAPSEPIVPGSIPSPPDREGFFRRRAAAPRRDRRLRDRRPRAFASSRARRPRAGSLVRVLVRCGFLEAREAVEAADGASSPGRAAGAFTRRRVFVLVVGGGRLVVSRRGDRRRRRSRRRFRGRACGRAWRIWRPCPARARSFGARRRRAPRRRFVRGAAPPESTPRSPRASPRASRGRAPRRSSPAPRGRVVLDDHLRVLRRRGLGVEEVARVAPRALELAAVPEQGLVPRRQDRRRRHARHGVDAEPRPPRPPPRPPPRRARRGAPWRRRAPGKVTTGRSVTARGSGAFATRRLLAVDLCY